MLCHVCGNAQRERVPDGRDLGEIQQFTFWKPPGTIYKLGMHTLSSLT